MKNNYEIKDQNLYYKSKTAEYRIRGFEEIILSHLRVNMKVTVGEEFYIDIVGV